jgi:hypothetical protein
MERPTEGCCGTCGYLSRRVRPAQYGGPRAHSIFAEVEPHERDQPRADANLVPGDANSWMQGEFGCFAHFVDLPKELSEAETSHPTNATEHVIWKDRHCPRWSKYEPGVVPRDQLQEVKQRAFEEDRRAFDRKLTEFEGRQDRRLTKAAIWLASIIGVAQIIASLLTMAKDSAAYPWFHAGYCWLWRLFH